MDLLPVEGAEELGRMHGRYLWAGPPGAGEKASAGYRMRMLILKLWEKWGRLRLFLRRPELGLDGADNATERAIGKNKFS